jgi:glycerophosphoryl diester phosphodiesterase
VTHRAGSAVALLAVAVLAACSGDDSTASTASTPATTVAATTSAPPSTTAASAPSTTTTSSTSTSNTSTAPTTVPAPPGPATVDDLLALGRPIVLAHTGGEDEFPASTMFAFGESMKAGVDMLDLNVQLTHDGVLVVHHDDTVDRTTDGTGNVAELDLQAIQALDDAYWFTADCVCKDRPDADYVYRGMRTGAQPPPAGYVADDFAVPTLRQLIERYPHVPLNVEVKGEGQHGIDTATALVAELNALGRLDATVLSSFDDGVVEALQRLAPTAEISPGLSASAGWVLNDTPLPPGQRILQLPPKFNDTEVLTPDVIARSHAAGYVIWVWPDDRALENAGGYAELLAMGMDGLNINFPATGVAAVDAFVAGG